MRGIKFYLKMIKYPDFLPILVVIIFGLLASKGLIGEGYFNMHDDLQMMRQLQMEKCFLDLQIPCRWVPDMGYGFGYPLFNFYPPLPYLIGEGIRLVGYSFVNTIKILFILSIVLSGVTMYFLAKEFFLPIGGVISAVFYIWAPYHAVDVYVRGAMNESWAMVWFPLILLAGYKLVVTENKYLVRWIIILALAYFGLFTSHNLMVLIFTPFFGLWCLIWIVFSKGYSRLFHLTIAGLLSFCLSAFFTLPVLLEMSEVATDTLVVGYYEYTAHFANLKQILISRFWGYGPSVWMAEDDRMSFQVGWIHWMLSIFIVLITLLRIAKTRKIENWKLVIVFFFTIGWFSAFMVHSKSTPIWHALEGQLKYVQFPWRFLTIVILSFSILAGSLNKLLAKILALPVGVVFAVAVVIYSWNYFLPENGKLGPLTDGEKFYGLAWDLQQTAGIYDYLPHSAKTAPNEPRRYLTEVVGGEGQLLTSSYGTDWAKVTIYMQTSGTMRVNIIDFPNWKIKIDGKEVEHYIPDVEKWGRMYINLPQGRHEVEVRLYDTWPRKLGNFLSLASWTSLGLWLVVRKRNV